MRKFIFLFVIALTMGAVMGCSCDNDTPWGVEYSLNSDGKTDASVDFAFVNGEFTLTGDANYTFVWSNAKGLSVEKSMPLSVALETNDVNTLGAAQYVNGWLDDQFKVVGFEGHYDIYIKGYVKETKTQITFSIDKHFTNIE